MGERKKSGGGGVEIKTLRRCCLKVDRRTVFSSGLGLYHVVGLL